MPDWTDTINRRRAGLVPGFVGQNEPLEPADTNPDVAGLPLVTDGKGQFALGPAGTSAPIGAALWYLDSQAGADDDAKMATALTQWSLSSTGGTIMLPDRACTFTQPWTIPNDGAAIPKQKYLRLASAGGHGWNGQWGTPVGGTTVDFTYNGAGPAKIDTRGLGVIEMDHIAFMDTSGGALPFFQTTLTTPMLHDLSFTGSKNGTACNQDCIVLGGTSTAIDGTSNAAFQGYGGSIDRIYFDRIRRGVYARTYCNNVTIANDLTFSSRCGGTTACGAIELLGQAGAACSGNYIGRVTLEASNYPYPIKLSQSVNNKIDCPGFYDPSATCLAYVRFENFATYNWYFVGFADDTHQNWSEDPTCVGTNMILTPHQTQESQWAQPIRFLNTVKFAGQAGVGPSILDNNGADVHMRVANGNTTTPKMSVCVTPATQVTDAVVTSGSQVVTSASNGFAGAVRGQQVGGTGIASGTRIDSVQSSGQITLDRNATATNTGSSFWFGKPGTEMVMTGFQKHHIVSTGAAAPSGALDPAAGNGSGGSIAITGFDLAHKVVLTTGSSVTNGTPGSPVQLAHWNHNLTFNAAPKLSFAAKDSGGAQLFIAGLYWVTTTSTVTLWCIGTVPVSTACTFDVTLIE